MKQTLTVLAIETSCDDTSIALLKSDGFKFDVLSSIVSSQVKKHQKYGGVYPSLAKREHQKNLPLVLKKALKEAHNPKINIIAVTVGPGLEPCLWVGINFAKELAKKIKLPVIPVNHIESHLLVNFLNKETQVSKLKFQELFPAIALVVSGGHTQLILMKNFGKYKILGETRDDAAGECFDKTARILGLPYPGGPEIAAAAQEFGNENNLNIKLPRPMITSKNYDFSFSGLKTAVLYDYKKRDPKTKKSKTYIGEMAKEIQQATIDVLLSKTIRAAKEFKAKTIIFGGGVIANDELRKQFTEKIKKDLPIVKYLIPDKKECTDNAVMTAITGYFRWRNGQKENWKDIRAEANLRI